MLRLIILILVSLPSISEGQIFFLPFINIQTSETDLSIKSDDILFIYLNKAYDNEDYQLVQDLIEDDFSREEIELRLDVDCGKLTRHQSTKKLALIKQKWATIKKNVVVLETKLHISPCFNHTKYSDTVYDLVGDFYNLDESVEKIIRPSQLIEKISLELALISYYRQNEYSNQPFNSSKPYHRQRHLMCTAIDTYVNGEETVKFHYLYIRFLNKKIPLSRDRIIYRVDDSGDNSFVTNKINFLTNVEKYKVYIKYIKYLHNNTSMDYSKDIIDFEELLIMETTKYDLSSAGIH